MTRVTGGPEVPRGDIAHPCGSQHIHLCNTCVRRTYTCCRPECMNIAQLGACPWCWPKRRGMSELVGRAVVVLALMLGGLGLATADETPTAAPTPSATAVPAIRWSTSAGYTMLLRQGEDRKYVVFARAQAVFDVACTPCAAPALSLFLRVDKSKLSTERPALTAVVSTEFDTLEVTGGVYRHVAGPLYVAAMYGQSIPLQAGKVDRYPETAGGGVFIGEPARGRWVFVGAGKDDAVGPGIKALVGWQIAIDGRLTSVGDLAGSSVKTGIAHAGFVVAVGR